MAATSPKRMRQVNFRVTEEEWDVLRALANLDETTVPTAAYRIVLRAIEVAVADEHVRADIANRAKARASATGKVVHLRQRQPRP